MQLRALAKNTLVSAAASSQPSAGRRTVGRLRATSASGLEVDDGDVPTPGYASVQEAMKAIAEGKFVVVMDDEDRENEGDLIIAADKVTPEAMAFMIRYTSGVVCVSMENDRCDALELPPMVVDKVRATPGSRQCSACVSPMQSGCRMLPVTGRFGWLRARERLGMYGSPQRKWGQRSAASACASSFPVSGLPRCRCWRTGARGVFRAAALESVWSENTLGWQQFDRRVLLAFRPSRRTMKSSGPLSVSPAISRRAPGRDTLHAAEARSFVDIWVANVLSECVTEAVHAACGSRSRSSRSAPQCCPSVLSGRGQSCHGRGSP